MHKYSYIARSAHLPGRAHARDPLREVALADSLVALADRLLRHSGLLRHLAECERAMHIDGVTVSVHRHFAE